MMLNHNGFLEITEIFVSESTMFGIKNAKDTNKQANQNETRGVSITAVVQK